MYDRIHIRLLENVKVGEWIIWGKAARQAKWAGEFLPFWRLKLMSKHVFMMIYMIGFISDCWNK